MTHRVTIRLEGSFSSTGTFDGVDQTQQACIDVFRKYRTSNWIENYTENVIDATTKNEVIDFDSEERWIAYRAELQAITGDSDIGDFTSTIVSAVDV